MTTLSFTILHGPEQVSGQQHQARGAELTIGRGAKCDWVLPDPRRSLSRTHCRFEMIGGAWQLLDLSANGTFINTSTEPLGHDQPYALRDGDRLRLGDYEIQVRMVAQAAAASPAPFGYADASNPFGGGSNEGAFAGVRLPGLDDPLPGAGGYEGVGGREAAPLAGAMSDHSPVASDAFAPPAVVPGDAAAAPDDWFRSLILSPQGAKALRAAVEARAAPPAVDPGNRPAPIQPLPPAAQPPSAGPFPGQPPSAGTVLAALAVLLQGAALPDDAIHRAAANPDKVLRQAGGVLQAVVAGLRALLVARGLVKREFRIEQTMLRVKENNPLKFAASDEQALAALLDPRTDAVRAVAQTIEDLTSHEVAVLAATQAAVRAMLERLAPAAVEAEDLGGGGLMPGATEKRLWAAYKRRHATLLVQLEDDFESVFGTAFARAYEQAVGSGDKR